MFSQLLTWIEGLSVLVPLELFVLIGSIIEELFSPIPSPLITTTAGFLVASGEGGWLPLLYLALIAAVAKTFSSLIIYVVADKAEDFILISVGPRLGLDHNKVESLGRRFRGTWRDYLTLIVIRAIPFFPTFVVSAACGVIKLNLRLYITGSLVGNYCRSIFFMLLGYAGFSASSQLLTELNSLQTWFEILFVLLAIAGLGWIYWKRRKRNL